jgi:hypothetical protein
VLKLFIRARYNRIDDRVKEIDIGTYQTATLTSPIKMNTLLFNACSLFLAVIRPTMKGLSG